MKARIMTAEGETHRGSPLAGENDEPLFVSYPKSGRTWIRYFLNLRGVPLEFTHAGTGSGRKEFGRHIKQFDTSGARRHRMIFMHRNPIDTAISLYFQIHRKDFQFGSRKYLKRWLVYSLQGRLPPRKLEDFLDHPGFGVEKTSRFNAAWIAELRSHPDSLVFSYEEARRNEEETFERLLNFLRADKANLSRTIEESSFRRMQQQEKVGAPKSLRLQVAIPGDPDSAKVRRGKVRGYMDYLTPAQVDKYRAIAAEYGFDA
jgi:hypothetical protein